MSPKIFYKFNPDQLIISAAFFNIACLLLGSIRILDENFGIQVSISPTFYAELFHTIVNFTNILRAAFMPIFLFLKYKHKKLQAKFLYSKAVRKMLVKLTPGRLASVYFPQFTFSLHFHYSNLNLTKGQFISYEGVK